MTYSNTHADFYQTAMGTLVTEPQSAWDISTHCADCGVQYVYCGCPADEIDFAEGSAVCGECDYITRGLFYFAGDSTGRCDYCHNNKRTMTWNSYPDW
jgi:hypothetical protein